MERTIPIRSIAVCAIAFGLFFRVHHLNYKVFWGDEVFGLFRTLGFTEAEIVRAGPQFRTAADVQTFLQLPALGHGPGRPLSATVRSLALEDPQHPPLYYVMVRLWVNLAGSTSVAALRALPALFGILSILGIGWLARELFGDRRAAWLATALYAVSPFAVLYSQEAREYSLWALATLVSSACLLRATRTNSVGNWAAYGAASVTSLYIYPLAALVMAAHSLFLLADREYRRRDLLRSFFLASAVAVLLYLPWLMVLWSSAAAGLHAMAAFISTRQSALSIALAFVRGIIMSILDLGWVQGKALHLARTLSQALVLMLILYAFADMMFRDRRTTVRNFVLAMLTVTALPLIAHDYVSGGATTEQLRYFVPSYIAVCLALASLFQQKIVAPAIGARPVVWMSIFVLVLLAGGLSCAISDQTGTWYVKACERSRDIAISINRSDRPLVVGDRATIGDRGTSRILELSFYLDPDVAIRVNTHCDGCLIPAPRPIDVFRDAGQFKNIYVLGTLFRNVPTGNYAVHHVGIVVDPATPGPLSMFEPYPR